MYSDLYFVELAAISDDQLLLLVAVILLYMHCLVCAALQAFCPVREIPKGKVHENVLEAFSIKDKVRGLQCSLAYVMLCGDDDISRCLSCFSYV